MQWTHMLCDDCWLSLRPDRPMPHRIVDEPVRPCCRCGELSNSGIFVRSHPDKMPNCACKDSPDAA